MSTPKYEPRRSSWIAALMVLLVCTLPLAGQSESRQDDASESMVATATSEYTGPAVLSRGNLPTIGQESSPTTFQPFFYVNQMYDTGMTIASGAFGVPLQPVAGVEAGFGVRGTHRWRRIVFNINYEGNIRQYSQQTGLSGTNQYFRTTAVIPLKRHLDLLLRQTVASVVQDGTSLSLQPFELSSPLPANEPFDNRARLFDSQAALMYQRSQRLSFTATMDGSVIQRDSPLLVGTDAVVVDGDVGYLLSRHATIGVDYNLSHYGYTIFGSANINIVRGNFSWRLSRTVGVAVQLGVSRTDILGLAVVPLDPDVAAILGVGSGIQVSRQAYEAPMIQCAITKRWRYVSADVDYQKGISPGNGLVLTSDSTSINTGLHYSLSRNWNLSMRAGRTTMQALGSMQGLGSTTVSSYVGYIADVSLTRSIGPNMVMEARFDARPFTYLGAGFQTRTFYSSRIGFRFTPREMPVALR